MGDVFYVVRPCVSFFSTLAVVTLLALPAEAKRDSPPSLGVATFFRGTGYLGDQLRSPVLVFDFPPLQRARTRTSKARAEVLRTPDVFLRVGR